MIERVDEILARYPSSVRRSMPLLHEVQERDGYVTEAGMEEVAETHRDYPGRGARGLLVLFHVQADTAREAARLGVHFGVVHGQRR